MGILLSNSGHRRFKYSILETAYHGAELAEHFVLGFEHLFTNKLHFRAEGYYKKMSDLQNVFYSFRDIDELFPEARDDLISLSLEKGTSKGVEFYLKYDTGNKFSWWLSYVLSDANNDVSNIQYDGRLIKQLGILPRPWDQRHTINIDSNYRLNKSWHFNFAWSYRTGWPATDFEVKRIQRDDGTFAYYHDFGIYYGNRYPNYQRLDVRINKHFYSSKGKITAFLHVINVYNHENIVSFDHEILEENQDNFRHEIAPETFFGILPFAGVSWEF